MDKRILESVFVEQKEELDTRKNEKLCVREEESLIELTSPQAQVVIGVRRSGKSTLCFKALENAGANYAYADFDDERLSTITAAELNDVLEVLYKIYGDFNCLFLDEIQNVKGWHLFVNRLLRQKMHVVLTGSNANLLSGELATHLSGRAKEIHLYPLTFAEYCLVKDVDTQSNTTKSKAARRAAFDNYMKQGGFPELLSILDARTYVIDLVNNILKRDIEQRYKISYKSAFEQMAHHLLNVTPTLSNAADLAKIFHFKSEHTAKNYLEYLKQAFLLVGVKKYAHKSRTRMTQEKLYAVDVAMMNQRADAFAGENLGWRLENVVLLHLLRKCKVNGWDIYYMKERSGECDFLICEGQNVLQAIQVSYDISQAKTRKREINGLLLASQLTQCTNLLLLTDYEYGEVDLNNHHISIRPVYDWACEQ